MLLTEINVDDLNRLERLRIDRLQLFFTSSLPHCLLQIDGSNMLCIYCLSSGTVDELLDELDDLCSHAWLILGVKKLSLHFGLEEILNTNIECSGLVNKSLIIEALDRHS
jgi:hypothetical protein